MRQRKCHKCGAPVKDRRATMCRPCYAASKREVVGDVKACRKCGEEKPISAFDKRTAKYADGSTARLPVSQCRKCRKSQFREAENERQKARYHRDRELALHHYSIEGPPACACCGELTKEFLTIDHINEDGAEHRRNNPGAIGIATWLRVRGFPEGYQILCMNCNSAKHRFGECPHVKFKRPGVELKSGVIVPDTVKIGKGSTIWPFSIIGDSTQIGENCCIGSHCYIGRDVVIGSNSRLQTGVFLPNGTIVEDGVFIGPQVTMTDDRRPKAGKPYFPEPPILRRGCSIGAGVTCLPGVEIGAGAMIGAGSVVTKNVFPGETIVGPYARPIEGKAA